MSSLHYTFFDALKYEKGRPASFLENNYIASFIAKQNSCIQDVPPGDFVDISARPTVHSY